jgi:hypothetical protein
MSSKFGNFVLEKALKTSSKAEFKLLTKAMNKNLKDISSSGMKQKWQEYLYDYEYWQVLWPKFMSLFYKNMSNSSFTNLYIIINKLRSEL